MLVLTRKVGKAIVVPECGLTVTVLGMVGDRIRLGISAPADLSIYREEAWERLQAGNHLDGAGPSSAAQEQVGGKSSYHAPGASA